MYMNKLLLNTIYGWMAGAQIHHGNDCVQFSNCHEHLTLLCVHSHLYTLMWTLSCMYTLICTLSCEHSHACTLSCVHSHVYTTLFSVTKLICLHMSAVILQHSCSKKTTRTSRVHLSVICSRSSSTWFIFGPLWVMHVPWCGFLFVISL